MKKITLILSISIALQCSKQEIVELPITTNSEKALVFYHKALVEWESGGYVEKTAYFDSSIAIDSNFALALLYNDNPDKILKKKRRKRKLNRNTVGTDTAADFPAAFAVHTDFV